MAQPEGSSALPHFATLAIHAGQDPDKWKSRAVVPPITLSVAFKQDVPQKKKAYKYTRFGNPSRDVVEEVMTALDDAKSDGQQEALLTSMAALDGAKRCLAYSSGMAATLNVCHLLKTGDTIICTWHVYAGTKELFDRIKKVFKINVVYADLTNLQNLKDELEKVTKPTETTLVWIETPTNPTLKVIDIKACADLAHQYKKCKVLVAVDNSFMSPYFQRPLSLGADICMSSATKYINGHGDVLMGLLSVNDKKLYEDLKVLQNCLGAVPSPFDCFLCNRGLKTLHIRMELHSKNAMAVAIFLKHHPGVKDAIYPGLPCHPQYQVMQKQSTGASGVVSFYIQGDKENAFAFLRNLKVFIVGYNVGDYESLAEHPATMTHASLTEDEKKCMGITDTLIRLSVGLEDKEDLLADLKQALEAAASMRTDERKRISLSWTHREEQKQSHSSHKPCALFPGSVSNPRAAFGQGFHPSRRLSTHFCSLLDGEMGSLDSTCQDAAIRDCTTHTCLEREVPQGATWGCSCLFPDIWLFDPDFCGCGCFWDVLCCPWVWGVSLRGGSCLWRGRAPLVLPPFPEVTGITRDLKPPPGTAPTVPGYPSPSAQPGLGHCQGSRGSPNSPSLCSQKCLNLGNCAGLLLFQVFLHAVAFSKGFFWPRFGSLHQISHEVWAAIPRSFIWSSAFPEVLPASSTSCLGALPRSSRHCLAGVLVLPTMLVPPEPSFHLQPLLGQGGR